jgi:protein AFG1
MNLEMRDQARRFIVLLDSLYENKKVLIASMDASIDELLSGSFALDNVTSAGKRDSFSGEEELFAFDRAVSRLKEMQSTEWLGPDLCYHLQ